MKSVGEIKWREPMFSQDSAHHTFKVDDRVRIARIADDMTLREIIGHCGIVTEIDDFSPSSVEMKCATCGGFHTMHEQELDFLGDDLVQMLQEKAGIMDEAVEVDQAYVNLEDLLAVSMHKAGFRQVCIKDKPLDLACDPRYPRPVWAKYVYGFITRLAPLRVHNDLLIKIAEQAGGYLAEWSAYSQKSGYDSVLTERDLDALTLEMPIRALMVAKATTDMGEYDDIKEMVLQWLQDKCQIDVAAIYRAVRDQGFRLGHWNYENGAYTVHLIREIADGLGHAKFIKWAEKHWEWSGTFNVYVHDEGRYLDGDTIEIKKKDGDASVKVTEYEDVPF